MRVVQQTRNRVTNTQSTCSSSSSIRNNRSDKGHTLKRMQVGESTVRHLHQANPPYKRTRHHISKDKQVRTRHPAMIYSNGTHQSHEESRQPVWRRVLCRGDKVGIITRQQTKAIQKQAASYFSSHQLDTRLSRLRPLHTTAIQHQMVEADGSKELSNSR